MKVSLTDRERTHGIYKDTAGLSQCIKDILRSGNNWSKLSDSQKEALEMLSVKLARILNGNPNFNDHWDDIVGYGQLGADSIKPTMPNITANLTSLMTQQAPQEDQDVVLTANRQ